MFKIFMYTYMPIYTMKWLNLASQNRDLNVHVWLYLDACFLFSTIRRTLHSNCFFILFPGTKNKNHIQTQLTI